MDQAQYVTALRNTAYGTPENIAATRTMTFGREGSLIFSRLLVNLMNPEMPSDIPVLESLGKRVHSALSFSNGSNEISMQINRAELKMLAAYVEPIVKNSGGLPGPLIDLVTVIYKESKEQ